MRRNIFHLLALLQIFLIVFAVKSVRSQEEGKDEGKDERKDEGKDDKEKKDEEKGHEGETGGKRVEMCGPGYAAECVPIGGIGEEEEPMKDCTEYKVELSSKDQQSVGVNPECTEVASEAKSKGLVPVSVYTLFASPDAQRSEGVPSNLYALTSSLFFNAAKNGNGGQNGGKNYNFLRGSVARAFGGHPPKDAKKDDKKKDKEKDKEKEKEKEGEGGSEKEKPEDKEVEGGAQLVDEISSNLAEKHSKGNSSLF